MVDRSRPAFPRYLSTTSRATLCLLNAWWINDSDTHSDDSSGSVPSRHGACGWWCLLSPSVASNSARPSCASSWFCSWSSRSTRAVFACAIWRCASTQYLREHSTSPVEMRFRQQLLSMCSRSDSLYVASTCARAAARTCSRRRARAVFCVVCEAKKRSHRTGTLCSQSWQLKPSGSRRLAQRVAACWT